MPVLDVLGSLRIGRQSLVPISRAVVNRSRGRAIQSQADAFMYWQCEFEGVMAKGANDALFQSIMAKIRAGGEGFLVHDLLRPRPILMDTGSPLADGEGTLATITDSLNVTISGLPSGFQLSQGDYVEFRESDGIRMLNIIGANATANGSGVVSVTLDYPLDTQNFTTASVVNFEKPSCIMQRIEPHSRSAERVHAQTSFSAVEIAS